MQRTPPPTPCLLSLGTIFYFNSRAAKAAADCYEAAKCDNSDAADKAVSEHCAGKDFLNVCLYIFLFVNYIFIFKKVFHIYGGILLLPTCKINYVNTRHTSNLCPLILGNMRDNHIKMRLN